MSCSGLLARTLAWEQVALPLRWRVTGFTTAVSVNHAVVGIAIPVVAASSCETAEGGGPVCVQFHARQPLHRVGCFVTPDERPRDVTAFCAGEWRDLTASVPLYLCEASCAGPIARQS